MFDTTRYGEPWRLTEGAPPLRLETPRLVLRCWQPTDAPLFKAALEANREHVGAWIPQALEESTALPAIERRLERFREEFLTGVGFVYAIFDPPGSQVLGEIGLMPRIGPGALEVGYWIGVDQVGRGFATEATRAVSVAALAVPGVGRIEIHCDPANAPSAAIPRRLGYRLISPEAAATLVFELTAEDEPTLPRDRWSP